MNATHASTMVIVLFTTLVMVVLLLFTMAARRVLPARGAFSWRTPVLLVLVVSVLIPGLLAAAGKLDRYTPLPAAALVMVAIVTVLTFGLALSPVGKAFATGIPLASLIWFQLFRVPVELCLHQLSVEGVVPVAMTYAGRNFDIISGLSAAIVAVAVVKGHGSRALVLLWNVIGLALLANIIIVAILSTPVPFRVFTDGPPNLLPSTFPFVWLPTVLVQAALFGHLVVFRALLSKRS